MANPSIRNHGRHLPRDLMVVTYSMVTYGTMMLRKSYIFTLILVGLQLVYSKIMLTQLVKI